MGNEVVATARTALVGKPTPKTEVVNPVNGTRPYSYVEFLGERVEFHPGGINYIDGQAIYDAATDEANAYANAISDLMFSIAQDAVKAALSAQHSDLADELDVERLADLMQEEPFSGDQHVEGTTDHRQRLEHYASLALRSNRAADADEITALRARVKELEGVLERVSEAISDQDECEAEAIISQALKGDKP